MEKNNYQKLATEWFIKACQDLEDAELLAKEGGHGDTICFLCQQSAEKFLKGFIVKNGFDIEGRFKIHDLVTLLNFCSKFNRSLKGLEDNCHILTKYYIGTRYPVEFPKEYTKEEIKEAIEFVEEIKEAILE